MRRPSGARDRAAQAWQELSASGAPSGTFTPELVADLPAAARRWLRYSIAPGTPLHRSAVVTMEGEIRLGAWRPFRARQVLAPPDGFVWRATARVAGLPVTGFDRRSGGTGEMRWRLAGLVPVMTSDGPDVTRSAGGRLAAEGVCVPTTFDLASWSAGEDDGACRATWQVGAGTEHVDLRVDDEGRLLSVRIDRWGDPDGTGWRRVPFGVTVEREATFHGVAVPAVYRAGWWAGTDQQDEGEFFRARVTDVAFA
ncbi:DUF6544 family protein [Cellulomonas massiliensis]|uniref:DUF6544 family protein n=1 Tax=Cellulomonas massiliensis TaxID=1465811 RepID=UPI0003021351|nr:DUF6544 family protein [Cellulomonas massiliensis]